MFWQSKILLFKIESTYGVDANPTGAANAVLAQNVSLKPMEGADVDRDLELPYFGAGGTIPTELMSELSFEVELEPSGVAGTAPAWGPIPRACAMAEVITPGTAVAYNPITHGQESATIYLHIDNALFKILGARGVMVLDVTAQGVPKIKVTFKGLFVLPADAARPTVDLAAWKDPKVASKANTPTFTIGGVALAMRTFKLDRGAKVEGDFLIGEEEVLITEGNASLETTVKAPTLTAFNPFQMALDTSAVAVQLVHGTTAGRRVTIDVPNAQMQRPQGMENVKNRVNWPLRLVPRPTIGNDDFTITLT